jgi:hypothetical protein
MIIMARRDGTGPMGQGPITGRGLGFCAGNVGTNTQFGRKNGFGIGAGYGCKRGFGGFFNNQFSGSTEKELLEQQKELIQKRLDAINKI